MVVKVLGPYGIASYNAYTIMDLDIKHPYKPPLSMSTTLFIKAPLVVEADIVFRCIKSFPKGTSCGRHGLRYQHLLDLMCKEGSIVSRDILCEISQVVSLWLRGGCSMSLAEFVASAPLMPLSKPVGEVWSIVVGSIWIQLVSNVAMKGVSKDVAQYLNDFQFGVGVSSGAEAILHSDNRVLSKRHGNVSFTMLTRDFTNAFNSVEQTTILQEMIKVRCLSIFLWVKFLYHHIARLYLRDEHTMLASGVKQGDPLWQIPFPLC